MVSARVAVEEAAGLRRDLADREEELASRGRIAADLKRAVAESELSVGELQRAVACKVASIAGLEGEARARNEELEGARRALCEGEAAREELRGKLGDALAVAADSFRFGSFGAEGDDEDRGARCHCHG